MTERFCDAVFPAVVARMLLEHSDDDTGRMLQSPGLRGPNGKFYGFATADDLIVKLPADRVSELVGTGQGMPCAPRPERPMREWVRLAGPDEDACVGYLEEARAFVVR